MNPSIATTRESVIVESEPLARSLTAGQRSVVDFQSVVAPPVIEEISLDSMDLRLAWKNERLDFTATRPKSKDTRPCRPGVPT